MGASEQHSQPDDFTVRVSRRTVRRVALVAMVVVALAVGIGIGAGIAGSGGGGDGPDREAASATTRRTADTTTSTRATTTTAPPATTTTAAPEVPAATGSSADGQAAGQAAAADVPVADQGAAAPPAAVPTANVSLSLSRACGGMALTTSVTVEWHGTLGQDYFLQVNQSNGVSLIHQGVGSDGTQTFANVACGLLPVHALFAVNTATGSVYANAST